MTSKHAYGAAVVLDDALYVLGGMDMLESFKTSNLKVEDSSPYTIANWVTTSVVQFLTFMKNLQFQF
jgi:hypothetical protein